ncbi:TraI/MobA(P) family conjugative relaxase [Escherichia coli]|nr:relaxase/mobilization nuclease domain-containing protein [Escherichia coli]
MISKRIPMNSAKKSSFAGLVNYITNSQGKNERVGEITITNCQSDSVRWAVGEALATQKQNTTAEGDKTYHLLISFAPGEQPSAEVLKDVEARLCAAMGYGEHQRISAVHHDTDALHIHVAINKIHPEKLTIHEPYRDFKTRARLCAQLEIEHDLVRVNHTGRKHQSENKADDMEHHAGIETLLSWVRRECLEQIQGAQTWNALHQALESNGLHIKERGAGLVIESHDGTVIKASTVDRSLSKSSLEKRLGGFQPLQRPRSRSNGQPPPNVKRPSVGKPGSKPPPFRRSRLGQLSDVETVEISSGKRYKKKPLQTGVSTDALYARFKQEQSSSVLIKRADIQHLRSSKTRLIEDAKRTARFKRAAIKVMGESALNKKLLYMLASRTLVDTIQKINKDHSKSVADVSALNKARTWADWLQAQSLKGDKDALRALRARGAGKGARSENLAAKATVASFGGVDSGEPQSAEFSMEDALKYGAFREDALSAADATESAVPLRDGITKEGTIIYHAGSSAIRDDGDKLQLSRGTTSDGIETALRMAMARYGQTITVEGSAEFKELVAQTAAARNLKIKFADAALEQRRQHWLEALKEKPNDRSESSDGRRSAGSSDGSDGRTAGTRRGTSGAGREASNGRRAGSDGPRPDTGPGPRTNVTGATPGGDESARPVTVRSAARAGKPGVGRVGRKPPPQAKGRMRTLSALDVVQHAGRSEVLLPGDVYEQLDVEGAKPDHQVRRPVHTGGLKSPEMSLEERNAVRQYIAEREEKRAKGFDIPKHTLYNLSHDGPATYAGVRQVNGQFMGLLKRGDEIVVLPVNEATARRMKRMTLGDDVTLTAKGVVKAKGRSR